jgi:hypothetical protein
VLEDVDGAGLVAPHSETARANKTARRSCSRRACAPAAQRTHARAPLCYFALHTRIDARKSDIELRLLQKGAALQRGDELQRGSLGRA